MGDTYKEVRTFHYKNAVVRVHIPDLSDAERERRLQSIKNAAAVLLAAPTTEKAQSSAVGKN